MALKNVKYLIKKNSNMTFKPLSRTSLINKKEKITGLYTKKYQFLINRKFFKKRQFNINSRGLKFDYIYFHSKRFRLSKFGKKFREYLKSPSFKKLINYKKHYKKFLEKKKEQEKKLNLN